MENIINAPTRPLPVCTLKDSSLIKLATTLINNEQLLDLILDFQGDFQARLYAKNGKQWENIQSLARQLLLENYKCPKINDVIIEFLWTLSYRIMLWRYTHAPFIGKEFMRQFYWTVRGRIDNKRTAMSIIENLDIPITKRLNVACSTCLFGEILEIWNKMSTMNRDILMNENDEKLPLRLLVLMGIELELNSDIFIDGFECATRFGLLDVVKLLLTNLPANPSLELLLFGLTILIKKAKETFFLEEDEIEIGCLLFSKIKEPDQTIVFNYRNEFVLSLMLHTSEREYFMRELTNRIPRLPTSVIQNFLYVLFYNFHLGVRNDYDYQELFIDVWRLIPDAVGNEIRANTKMGTHFLKILIKEGYRHLVEDAPENGTFSDSASQCSISITPDCFQKDKWKFLLFLIDEGIVTNPSLMEYRSFFSNFLEGEEISKFTARSLKICE